jgi:hypothetical protein
MNHRCSQVLDQVTALAEGTSSPEAELHVAQCPSCAARLAELRKILQATALPMFNAPDDVVAQAQALMPNLAPRRRLRLVASTFGMAGARSMTQDFHLVVGSDEESVRLMYRQEDGGWEVIGRAPSPEWLLSRPEADEPVGQEGHFSFRASSLADTSFALVRGQTRLDIPSADELLEESPSS